jgi:hypothetical protein
MSLRLPRQIRARIEVAGRLQLFEIRRMPGFRPRIAAALDKLAFDPVELAVLLSLVEPAEWDRIDSYPGAILANAGRADGFAIFPREGGISLNGDEHALSGHAGPSSEVIQNVATTQCSLQGLRDAVPMAFLWLVFIACQGDALAGLDPAAEFRKSGALPG